MTTITPPRLASDIADIAGAERRMDAVAVLSGLVAMLFLLPAHLVVGPVGAFGTPAMLTGLGCLVWWLSGRVVPEIGAVRGPQPMRAVLLGYAWFMLVAYTVGMLRPLTETEGNGANRAALTLLSLVGIALLAMDGIESRQRLETLLRRIVTAGVVVAGVGILQFFTGMRLVDLIEVPGLSENHTLSAIGSRATFNRPYSTALHPIEFGVVVASLLPLALHFAFQASSARARHRAWAKVLLLGAAVPMAISRSAVVAMAAALLALATAWDWRRRANVALATLAFTVGMWALVPGLIGTVRSLFRGLDTDTSVQARLDRIPRIEALFAERPWLGRGLGTYSQDDYFLIDNEWYVSAIETGLVGVAVILALIVSAITIARLTGRRYGEEGPRHLGYAVAATLFALFATIGTFDAFYYHIYTGLLFLLMGCAGALHRLQREEACHGRPGRLQVR